MIAFTDAEKAQLQAEHPDMILLAVVKDRARKMLLIPRAHKDKVVSFHGHQITLSMLHGGTYYIGGDPDVPALDIPDPNRARGTNDVVSGHSARGVLPRMGPRTPSTKTGPR